MKKHSSLLFLIFCLWGMDANAWNNDIQWNHPVYQDTASPYAPFPWPCDEYGDCADKNFLGSKNQDSPYAPFPWPCDEYGDCADNNFLGSKNQDSPYAPFPWPCDEYGDCADNNFLGGKNQDSPYAPFPWPCDEYGDCADNNFLGGKNQDSPYAPFPWPCDEYGDCAEKIGEHNLSIDHDENSEDFEIEKSLEQAHQNNFISSLLDDWICQTQEEDCDYNSNSVFVW